LDDEGSNRFVPIRFQQSDSGHDLAAGPIPWTPTPSIGLSGEIHEGVDVYTYGFPLAKAIQMDDGIRKFNIWLRMFKGYVVSSTILEFVDFPDAPGFELDMPAPAGLSGAPILRDRPGQAGTLSLVGVLHGELRVEQGFAEPVEEVRLARVYSSDAVTELLAQS
jgi:hypothetical protein